MAAAYFIRSSFAAMRMSPGEHLAAEIKRQGLTRQALAKLLGVQWPTIDRWTKDDGFNEKNQTSAALAMGLQWDHFRAVEPAVAHRLACEQALQRFLNSPIAPPDISEAEKATLASVRFPLDKVPTPQFYPAFILMLRGWLQEQDFERELKENEELHQQKNAEMARMRQAVEADRKPPKTRSVKKRKK